MIATIRLLEFGLCVSWGSHKDCNVLHALIFTTSVVATFIAMTPQLMWRVVAGHQIGPSLVLPNCGVVVNQTWLLLCEWVCFLQMSVLHGRLFSFSLFSLVPNPSFITFLSHPTPPPSVHWMIWSPLSPPPSSLELGFVVPSSKVERKGSDWVNEKGDRETTTSQVFDLLCWPKWLKVSMVISYPISKRSCSNIH
jgi:hypothetical protein